MKEENIKTLIRNLRKQVEKVEREHPNEVSEPSYWRGVKIGLETSIIVAENLIRKHN